MFFLFFCFFYLGNQKIVHISATKYLIDMGFESKYSFLNGQLHHIIKSNLDIADKWLISLDHVTYVYFHQRN